MKVNNQDADPGCYIAGHHGQYGIDGLADVAAQFGIELLDEDTPAYWRRGAEAEDSGDSIIVSNGFGKLGNHIARPDECWEQWASAGDAIEERLNNLTEGGSWEWQDGELFLVQTEVEGWVYVLADDYDAAWAAIVMEPSVGYLDEEEALNRVTDCEEGTKVFHFRATITYEPEDQ